MTVLLGSAIKSLYGQMDRMGFSSGEEFAVAMREARALEVPVLLGDQDVQVTLRRLSEALKKTDFSSLQTLNAPESMPTPLASVASSASTVDMSDASQISALVENLKQREAVRELTETLRREVPLIYDAMIGERDSYMASSLLMAQRADSGLKVAVGIVGIAHADGIERNLVEAVWKATACVI